MAEMRMTYEGREVSDLRGEVERLRRELEQSRKTAKDLVGITEMLQKSRDKYKARAESAEAVARAAADLAKHERTLRDNTVPVREHIAAQDGQRAAWPVLFAALDQWKGQP